MRLAVAALVFVTLSSCQPPPGKDAIGVIRLGASFGAAAITDAANDRFTGSATDLRGEVGATIRKLANERFDLTLRVGVGSIQTEGDSDANANVTEIEIDGQEFFVGPAIRLTAGDDEGARFYSELYLGYGSIDGDVTGTVGIQRVEVDGKSTGFAIGGGLGAEFPVAQNRDVSIGLDARLGYYDSDTFLDIDRASIGIAAAYTIRF